MLFMENKDFEQVTFDTGEFRESPTHLQVPKSSVAQWIIKFSGGFIKNETQANFVLLVIAVIFILISLVLIFRRDPVLPPINSITTADVLPR